VTLVERLTVLAGAEEPVSSADVMAYGRITDPTEEPLVASLITAAREELERLTGRIVLPGTFRIEADAWLSAVELPLAPIVSIDAVTYVTVDDLVPPDPPVALAAVDGLRTPLAYLGRGRVGVAPLSTSTAPVLLRIDVTAGYATPDAVPPGIRQYVRTLTLLRYQHRDDPEALAKAQAYAESGVTSFGVVQA